MTAPEGESPSPSPSPSPGGRRQRAPTITIDTSAVNNPNLPQDMESDAVALQHLSSSPTAIQVEEASPPMNEGPVNPPNNFPRQASHSSHASQASRISIPELRASNSFESRDRDSRPTSPHHVSSPASRGGDKATGFLAVPGLRSRQNSIESDDGNHANTNYSGDTLANSSQADKDRAKNALGNNDVTNDPDALTPDPGTEEDFQPVDNSFAFSQGQLNKLINPKSLSAFYALGGPLGLEKGLRTNLKAGLSMDEGDLDGVVTFEEATAAAQQAAATGNDDSKSPLARIESKDSHTSARRRSPASDEAFFDRKRIYSDNRLPVKKGKSLLQLMWITYNDKVLMLLSIAAVISLAIGLYQTFGTAHDAEHPPIEWVEGVAIIVAILIVVIVGSLNDYQKERQFVKLNKKKQDRDVNVIRSGTTREISVFDILVGDVMTLTPGDMIPVDGIFIDGHNIKCDESQTTGESDLIRKTPAHAVYSAIENHDNLRKLDPFILSGAQVTEGVGTFVVTATGVNSSYGKTLMSLREDPEVTPLQSKLNRLATYIAKLGAAAGGLLFIVLFIEFLVRLPHNHSTPTEKGQSFLNIFIVTVTIIVVAVPEGLPLAVTLALAFATTRMLKDNNLVRHLKACEVMGNATTICSDKTGTLTENKMTVVAGTLGTTSRFGGTVDTSDADSTNGKGKQTQNTVVENVPAQEVVAALHPGVKMMLLQSIAINSTAFEGDVDGVHTFIGSKTETALLEFSKELLGMGPVDEERSNGNIVQLIPFDSGRKCMGVVVRLDKNKYRLYVKGASEILLEKCSSVIRDPTKEPASSTMTPDNRQTLLSLIDNYASRSLRTIAMVYRDFDRWPAKGARTVEGERTEVVFEDVFKNMVLLGIVGIQDPLRQGVSEAVKTCQNAGVVVRMVTGDNLITAKAIATECGIYTAGGVVMEGPAFRKLSAAKMDQIIPRLQVLARSSPEDKRILVKRLKELGETVAVTGDGTNDAPALKTADVGFSMGIAGTEVAKEASAIILMDDNFNSIVKAMMWGRAVNDAVKKFLQFQVTVNITAVLLTFITAVASGSEQSVLTAVQLLWVNLIMDTMAALALATDPPMPSILDRKPDPKSAPLISITMWKMIIGEAIYQLAITLLLHFGAKSILSYTSPRELNQVPTLVFNTFVWMQIFNQWNNRRLDNKFNIFEGITRNWFFIGINVVMVGGQVMIIFVGGKAFNVVQLNAAQWAYSVVLGFLSIPVGAVIRLVPDELILRLIPDYIKNRPKGPELTISDEEEQFRFPKPLADVKEELSFLKKVKGGRLNNLKFAIEQTRDHILPRSRSGSRSRSNSIPHTPNNEPQREDELGNPPPTPESRKRGRTNRSRSNSALGATTVMAGIIAGSVAGWSPIERNYSDGDSIGFSRHNARAELESRDDVETHPGTNPQDPIITEDPRGLSVPPSQVEDVTPATTSGSSPPQSPPQPSGKSTS
ncbi:putative calcium P-type ATPase NCA-2 [Venustampulla echinocandica]|uniref:Calcium-transporting ATPase n=1 Tax=Venustampulla echinocandica TaxID=2656787 RepID=A0A370U248_9HELO|nr:putative calcium P-type ATPase NCA-2 [Venustampulla echinocandica]RDL41841.1 putative calcium P-type ATPase NCA-2 [Venustampulla echinocandica]